MTSASSLPWGERVAIVGAYESPLRKAPGVHPFAIQAECIRGALDDAGLELSDVDGFCTAVGFPDEGGEVQDVLELADWIGIQPTYVDGTDVGGASSTSQIGHAAAAITAGLADVVVVSYAGSAGVPFWPEIETQSLLAGPGQYEVPHGWTTVAGYALAARRHMFEFGTTPEQLAAVAVQFREHASHNPDARYRQPQTIDDVLASPLIADPLHRNDCCVITDGGGAVVLTGSRRAADCRAKPVWVRGFGDAVGTLQSSQMKSMTVTPARTAGDLAFATAGMTRDEIDCVQLYDSFTITTLLVLEDLGFCEKGDGGPFAASGALGRHGALPTNTDGGGLSSNHPGRRSIFGVIEAVRQLRGTATMQLDAPRTALAHGAGGVLSNASVVILGV